MYNKFIKKDGEVLLDLTDDSVSSSDLLQGVTAHDRSGEVVEGSIPIKTSEDLTVNGAMVTVPKGYYASSVTKSVATASQATPSISVNSSGLITTYATQTAGYVSAGTKTSTHQLAFQPAKTITPSTASQIAVSSGYYTGGNITVQGDANLVAGNIKSGVSIFGVSGTYAGSGSGGDTNMEDSLVTKTLTNYTNNRITTIGNHAFTQCSSLISVSFPAVTTIGRNAFYSCINLTSVSFPAATTIGRDAFTYCSSLTSVNFPAVTTIGSGAFYDCIGLTSVSFPAATTISSSAFYYCKGLTSVSFPAATTIGNQAFYYCRNLASIYLKNSSVCSLAGSSAFNTTSIGSNKGSIYVPSSLVASYKTATNWAYFSNRIYGI